jgi:hypothetical protein
MRRKQAIENESKEKVYRGPFLGLPKVKWTTSALYIKFVNPILP